MTFKICYLDLLNRSLFGVFNLLYLIYLSNNVVNIF